MVVVVIIVDEVIVIVLVLVLVFVTGRVVAILGAGETSDAGAVACTAPLTVVMVQAKRGGRGGGGSGVLGKRLVALRTAAVTALGRGGGAREAVVGEREAELGMVAAGG